MKEIFILSLFILTMFLWIACVFFTNSEKSACIGFVAFLSSISFTLCGYDAYINNKN